MAKRKRKKNAKPQDTIKISGMDLPNEFHIQEKLKGKKVHKSKKAYDRKKYKNKENW